MTTTDNNFCPRCSKPVWNAINTAHTCTPPDKTRLSSHWFGCWNTRGHHDCAIRRIEELEQALENSGPL